MNAGSHRVLVSPDPSNQYHSYQLYSCLLQELSRIACLKKGVESYGRCSSWFGNYDCCCDVIAFAIEVAEQAINQSGVIRLVLGKNNVEKCRHN